jgi:hypothetical protein
MKRAEAEKLDRLIGQIDALHREISAAGKKSGTDAVNEFKLGFINTVLGAANDFLGNARPFPGFQQFDIVSLPSNSDVTFMLAQYAEALELIRSRSIEKDYSGWHYALSDGSSRIPTGPPESLNRSG